MTNSIHQYVLVLPFVKHPIHSPQQITILSHNFTYNYTAFFMHFQQNTFRYCVINFTKMETLFSTLSVKVGDTVGEYGRKTEIS